MQFEFVEEKQKLYLNSVKNADTSKSKSVEEKQKLYLNKKHKKECKEKLFSWRETKVVFKSIKRIMEKF